MLEANLIVLLGILLLGIGGILEAYLNNNYLGGIAAILLAIANYILFTK